MTPLERTVLEALSTDWATTTEVRDALPGPTRAVGDVAWALRTLRRHGHAERRIVGDRGHLWRLAETPG